MPDFLHTFIRLINWASVRPETMTARGRVEETAAPLPSGSARMSASLLGLLRRYPDLRHIGNPHHAQNRVELGLASRREPA